MRLWVAVVVSVVGGVAPAVAHAGSRLVMNTADSGPGSLRQALLDANNRDNILFTIPGSGNHVIAVSTALPALPPGVTIDGTTEPNGTIQIDGKNVLTGDGITLNNGSNQGQGVADVRGLYITSFKGGAGINLNTTHLSHFIAGNFIGITPAGTAAGNGTGIIAHGGGFDKIGTAAAADRNVISGNIGDGIHLLSGTSEGISGNYIGTNLTGTAVLGNGGAGVHLSAGASVGGFNSGEGNVISGNNTGILVDGAGSAGAATIVGNLLGYAADGTTVLGNTGSAVAFGAGTSGSQVGSGTAPNKIVYTTGEWGVNIGSTSNIAASNSGFGDPTQWILSTAPAPQVTNLGGGMYEVDVHGLMPNQGYALELYSDASSSIRFRKMGGGTADPQGNVKRVEPFALVQGEFLCATITTDNGTSSMPCEQTTRPVTHQFVPPPGCSVLEPQPVAPHFSRLARAKQKRQTDDAVKNELFVFRRAPLSESPLGSSQATSAAASHGHHIAGNGITKGKHNPKGTGKLVFSTPPSTPSFRCKPPPPPTDCIKHRGRIHGPTSFRLGALMMVNPSRAHKGQVIDLTLPCPPPEFKFTDFILPLFVTQKSFYNNRPGVIGNVGFEPEFSVVSPTHIQLIVPDDLPTNQGPFVLSVGNIRAPGGNGVGHTSNNITIVP